jgi:hypothetical protein
MSDISILIQGPLHENSMRESVLETYEKYGEVVVSTWDSPSPCKIPESFSAPFIVHPQPTLGGNVSGVLDGSSFYYATNSILNGLAHVKTKYVIKTRSDECFSNFEPLIEPFLEDPDRLVCANIFARAWDDKPYHIGDHIFMARTDLLRSGLNHLVAMQSGFLPLESWAAEGAKPGNFLDATCEVVLALSFLWAKGILQPGPTWWQDQNINNIDTFKDNFHIVNVNELDGYRLRRSGAKKEWYKGQPDYPDDLFSNHHAVDTMDDATS